MKNKKAGFSLNMETGFFIFECWSENWNLKRGSQNCREKF